jgi:hypothetical protein
VNSPAPGRPSAAPLVYLAVAWLLQGAIVNTYLFHISELGRLGILLHSGLLLVLLAVCLLPFTAHAIRRLPSSRLSLALLLTLVHCTLLLSYAVMVLGCKSLNFMPTPELMAAYARPLLAAALVLSAAHLLIAVGVAAVGLSLAFTYYLVSPALLQALRAATPGRGSPLNYEPTLIALAAFACFYALSYRQWTSHEPLHLFLFDGGGAGKMIPAGILKVRRGTASPSASLVPAGRVRLRPRNLVLITIDALRSDQMEVYGSPYADTPFLSGLYQKGKLRRVDESYSVCTFSFCGLLGTLSSSYWHQLTGNSLMLTDALTHYGYQCRLLLSGDHTHFMGLRQYYGSNITEYHDGSSLAWNEMNDDRRILPWLSQIKWAPDQPTFLDIHLMAVHFLGIRQPAFERWKPSVVSDASLLGGNPAPETYQNHYRNGILQSDDELRQIFNLLEQQGVLQNALVIITADHGDPWGSWGDLDTGRSPTNLSSGFRC